MDGNPNDDIIRQTALKYHWLFRSATRTFLDHEDLVQEITLRLLSKGLYRSPERALVRRSADCMCLDYLRETVPGFRAKDIQPPPESIDAPGSLVEPSEGLPTDASIDIRRCLETELDSRERAVVLSQLRGHSQSEIAGLLGISQQRVWTIRDRALSKLRLKMAEPLPA